MKFYNQPYIPDYDLITAYDGSGRPQYIGIAKPGSLTSEAKWQIFKQSYDVNGRMEKRRYANKGVSNLVFDDKGNYSYTDI